MRSRPQNSPGAGGADPRGKAPVGFTMVEMVVALGVACLLMVGVVAFLVNGVVSTAKTSTINDTTAKARYVFEHLSGEMAKAADLSLVNFGTPNNVLTPTAYSSFNYRINVSTSGSTALTPLTSSSIVIDIPASSSPGGLVPQVGDFLS